jgi:hypothetical protein
MVFYFNAQEYEEYEIYEENSFDMKDDMTESEPSQLHEGPAENEVSDAATPDSERVAGRRGKKRSLMHWLPRLVLQREGGQSVHNAGSILLWSKQ